MSNPHLPLPDCTRSSEFFILHPSSLILHPSAFILHPSYFILDVRDHTAGQASSVTLRTSVTLDAKDQQLFAQLLGSDPAGRDGSVRLP